MSVGGGGGGGGSRSRGCGHGRSGGLAMDGSLSLSGRNNFSTGVLGHGTDGWLEQCLLEDRAAIEGLLRLRHADMLRSWRMRKELFEAPPIEEPPEPVSPRCLTPTAHCGGGGILGDAADAAAGTMDDGAIGAMAPTVVPVVVPLAKDADVAMKERAEEEVHGRSSAAAAATAAATAAARAVTAPLPGCCSPSSAVIAVEGRPCDSSSPSRRSMFRSKKVASMLFGAGLLSKTGTLESEKGGGHDGGPTGRRPFSAWASMKGFLTSTNCEMISGVLIMLNTVVMALQRQYEGFDNAVNVHYPGYSSALETWPGAQNAFDLLEWVFGMIFLLEVVLKIVFLRVNFFTDSRWNIFDFTIVALWCVDRIEFADWGLNPMVLRLARLARLLRLLRIVRWVKFFDPLHLMVKSIQSSASILVWSLVLLCLLMAVIAMFVGQVLQSFIRDDQIDDLVRIEVFQSWGNFTRSVVTMFEITLANWGPPCWLLLNNVDEWWGLFFVLYKCSFGFAVVQVITSVFIQQTFKVASRDEEVMIKERAAATQAYIKSLDRLFNALDESGDGAITWDEFESVLTDEKMKAWFAAIEVDAHELSSLFELLDDGDGQILRDEFIDSIKKLKGPAKSTDLLSLRRECRKLAKHVSLIGDDVAKLALLRDIHLDRAYLEDLGLRKTSL